MKRIKIIAILSLTLATYSCKEKIEKRLYYYNGNLKSIVKNNAKGNPIAEISFDLVGDTSSVIDFITGRAFKYDYDSARNVKKVSELKNGILDGEALEYVNNKLRFKVDFKDGKRDGKIIGFYDSGNLRLEGKFVNDTLSNMNEFDREGNCINSHFVLDYDVLNDNDSVCFSIHTTHDFKGVEDRDFLMALFKLQDGKKIKLTNEIYISRSNKERTFKTSLSILDSGSYKVRFAVPLMSNGESIQMIYDLYFKIETDEKVVKTTNKNSSPPNNQIKIKW